MAHAADSSVVELRASVRARRSEMAAESDGLIDIPLHIHAPVPDPKQRDAALRLRARIMQTLHGDDDGARAARAYCASDLNIHRFLRARKYDEEAAYQLLVECLQWRSKVKPWSISCEDMQSQFRLGGKMQVSGFDKWGRPVLIMDQSMQPPKISDQMQLDYLAFHLERARYYMIRNQGHEVDRWVVIINVERFSLFNTPSLSTCAEVVRVLMSRFPEYLGHMIVWRAPMLFWGLWKAMKLLIDENTQRKIVFVSGRNQCPKVEKQMQTIIGDDWRKLCEIDDSGAQQRVQPPESAYPGLPHGPYYDQDVYEQRMIDDTPAVIANAFQEPSMMS